MNATATTAPAQSDHAGPSEDTAWAAVLGRDHGYDGGFFYAVRSTGIYCRPSCPAKKPRRENVEFFRTPQEAEGQGYRACRRCRPHSTSGSMAECSVHKAIEYLDTHRDEPITLERLAAEVGMSPFHLQRTFKARMGLSPRAYLNARRLERFKTRLKQGDLVSRATYEAGFNSSRSVYQQATAGLGMPPGVYRRGGRGLTIRFATLPVRGGWVLVAATERGVCAVSLGADTYALEADLRGEFPAASIGRDDTGLQEWTTAIVRHLEGRDTGLAVPVDLHGTAFQVQVWKALREIPYGETRSYAEVAAAMGRPSAARAIARACASNKAALVVPCHRVVRGDGALGGYRWGMERKQHLLEQERGGNHGNHVS